MCANVRFKSHGVLMSHIAASAYLQAPLIEGPRELPGYPGIMMSSGYIVGPDEPIWPGKVFTPEALRDASGEIYRHRTLPPVGALLQRNDGMTVRVLRYDWGSDCIIGAVLGTREAVTIPFEALTVSVD
jgi:hypothetical protein